jgi:serine/threonine protein phosphatase PrpC
MANIFDYISQNDTEVYRTLNSTIGEKNTIAITIDAGTISGRKLPGSDPKPNEDAFSINLIDNTLLAAVLDGASSQKPIAALKDQTGARFASHFLRNFIQSSSESDVGKLLRQANRFLLEQTLQFEGATLSDVHTLPASTATIIKIDPDSDMLHLGHVGDTFCMLLYKDGHTELKTLDRNQPYDEKLLGEMKAIAIESHITPREAKQDPRVRQAVIDMFQDSFNRPDGTGQGIVNGDPQVEQYIQDLSVPLKDIEAILLGSDGLIPPGWDERKPADRQKLFTIAASEGMRGLMSNKVKIENDDPDWWHPRYKHSDDATAIYIRL